MMRPVPPRNCPRLACACALLASSLIAHAAAPAARDKIQALDRTVVAVTDVTEAGRALPVPTARNPVYFAGLNAGFRVYAGAPFARDTPPTDKAMLAVITEVLAKQHFLAADAAHPATQMIVCSWGVFGGGGLEFLGGKKLNLIEEDTIPGHLSGDIFCRRFRAGEAETVLSMSLNPLYAVLLRAYDLEKALKGDIVLLWETRLSCPTSGTELQKALPGLVVAGQRVVGRETPQPVVRNAARTPDAWVEIGESKVIEFIDISNLGRRQESPPAGIKE